MKRVETVHKALRIAVTVFALFIAHSAANAQTAQEQQCYNAVQGKVAWNQAGSTTWGEGNLRNLCQGTTNPGATISCFQGQIRQHNDWSRAITACKARPAQAASSGSSQQYQQYLSNEPGKSDVYSEREFVVRLGAATGGGSGSTATTTASLNNDERGLPFTNFTDYPDFYVIPPEKRPLIMNQGSCGSCVAWASSTALASVVAMEGKYKSFLAPLHMPDAIQLFMLSGRMCTKDLPNYAWYTNEGVARLTNDGIMVSTVVPASNKGVLGGSFATPMQADGQYWWIKAGKSGYLTNKDAMRKFIATKGALVADLDITPDFNRYDRGIYNHQQFVSALIKPLQILNQHNAAKSLEDELNKVKGGHAVTVIGYFKGGRIKMRDFVRPILASSVDISIIPDIEIPNMPAFWIVQNSWGNKWGLNGLFYVAANQRYNALYLNKDTKVWESKPADTIDNWMYYMLEPKVTWKGREIP